MFSCFFLLFQGEQFTRNECCTGYKRESLNLFLTIIVFCSVSIFQALNRVHRIGQGHSVRCVIFYAKNSCEERLLALRHRQGQLTETLSATSGNGASTGDGDEATHINYFNDDIASSSSSSASSTSNKFSSPRSMTGVGTEGFFSAPNLKLIFGVTEERDAIRTAEAAATQEALGSTVRRPRPP